MKKIQLTDTHKEKLFQIPLFRDLPLNIKESLLEKLDFVIYAADKKEIVVTQGTPCNKLYVLNISLRHALLPLHIFLIQTIHCLPRSPPLKTV